MGDDPAYLPVGTAVSAKYKGAFCEAKVSKVVRVVKCKITYKGGLGTSTVTDEHIRGPLRIGHTVQARHPEKKEYIEATITKIQDCSQYTVVFDDGDITTLRRTALCLKSGRHFNESETLDQLPLTHPEHWGFPVGGGRGGRGRRSRGGGGVDDLNDDMSVMGDNGPMSPNERDRPDPLTEMYSSDIGKVVCVEAGDKKKRDNWFPGLVVVPSAQPTVRINVREEYLIRSFKDGRYYTVPRKEILEFSRDMGRGVENTSLQEAMERALKYLDRDELPTHWERGPLFDLQLAESDSDAVASDSSDDEPREEKDHFVAQLYKFMDDRGTPLNKNPTIGGRDVDLYRLFRVVQKLGGCNRVTNQNKWRSVAIRLGYAHNQSTINSVRQAYKKFLLNFEDFYRKLGCTMINHPRTALSIASAKKSRGRSLIRDRDRATPSSPKPGTSKDSIGGDMEKRDTDSQSDAPEPPDTSNSSSDLDGSQTPRASKSRPKSRTGKARPGGEKVKTLVDKFEEHARASSTTNVEEDKPSQRPRSKSVGPQRSTTTTSGRATPGPRTIQKTIEKEKEKEKEIEKEKPEKEMKVEKVEKEKSKPKPIKPEKKEEKENPETERQQRGRKRKEENTSSTDMSDETTQSEVTANIGDKLKVYYGPTHESKVTYEAKVLDIDRDHGCTTYLVHYTGWNMRYDEWIRPQRIAENLSAINKAARQQQKGPSKSVASPKTNPKRGRGTSTSSSAGKEPRSITPQSTRSPSRRAAHQTRRTRRTSVVSTITSDTDDDQADDTKSDSEPEILPQSRTRSTTKIEEQNSDKKVRKGKRKEENEKDDKEKEEEIVPPKRAKRLVKKPPIVEKTTDESDEDGGPPKGRDFDLNQIRSELKGFEKAVKLPAPAIEESSEDKATTSENETGSKPIEKSPQSTDDIYEFKEPEPFEFEQRKLTPVDTEKTKKRLKRDESPPVEKSPTTPPSPKKKGGKSPSNSQDTKDNPDTKKRTPNTYNRRQRKTPMINEDEAEKKNVDIFDKLAESPSYNVGLSGKVKLNLDDSPPPLFRDLPASTVEIGNIEDSGSCSEDLGPEPPPFDQQPASTLDHIFKGFTESVKPIDPPSSVPSSTSIEKTPINVTTSDDDDPIGTAIHRVMSHTMTDESSSGDELFIRTTPAQKKIDKQISPALQETDSRLLEAISQQTQNLFKKDDKIKSESEIKRESPPLKPKIADTLLQKLSMIKSNESNDSNESENEKTEPILPTEIKIEPKEIEIKTEVIEEPPKVSKVPPKPKVEPKEVQKPKPIEKIETPTKTLVEKAKIVPKVIETKPEPKRVQVVVKIEPVVPEKHEKPEKVQAKVEKVQLKVEEVEKKVPLPIVASSEEVELAATSKIEVAEICEEILIKKRPVRKQAISREYVVESDSDSSSSSDNSSTSETENDSSSDGLQNRRPKRTRLPGRLVIAQDDESQDPVEEEKPIEEIEIPVVQTLEIKEEEPSSDISLLLCKETIPGSPASSDAGGGSNKPNQNLQSSNENVRTTPKPRSAKSLMLEMPFASAPTSASNTIQTNIENEKVTNTNLRSPPPLAERLKEEPIRITNQPQKSNDDYNRRVSTSQDDEEDNLMSVETKKPHEQGVGVGRKRRRSHRATDDIPITQPSTSQPPPAKRGRKPLNRNLNLTDPNSDDEVSPPSQPHRTPPRSMHIHPRYNFLVELDPNMDGPSRIALLQQKLTELRKTYNDVKNELAIIDRRRKKLRRRERDQLKQHKQEMLQAAA